MVPPDHPRHRPARPARHHPHHHLGDPRQDHHQPRKRGASMAIRPATTTPVAKLTGGDLITIDGLGAVAVIRPEPYGSQALIRLAWDNLAVIAPRDITWKA